MEFAIGFIGPMNTRDSSDEKFYEGHGIIDMKLGMQDVIKKLKGGEKITIIYLTEQ